jgi:hypothetical protein
VADITYTPTWAGFLYLAVVLDAFSRKIVGWAMETWLFATCPARAQRAGHGAAATTATICLQRSKNDQFRVLKVIHPQGDFDTVIWVRQAKPGKGGWVTETFR